MEVTKRTKDGKSFTFLLNHSDEVKQIRLSDDTYKDILTKKIYHGEAILEPKGVLIITPV